MATPNRQTPHAPVQAALAHYLPLERNFKDATKLYTRFRQAQGFRQYLQRRAAFVVPMVALFVLVSVACTAATVIFLADRHALLALPGMMLAPFVLIGSLFVEAFVFFSWLEGRALAQALGRRSKRDFDFGQMPQNVPWVLAALFLVLPLFILASVSFTAALVLILLAVGIIVAIAKFDR
jgi:hypothetical protein